MVMGYGHDTLPPASSLTQSFYNIPAPVGGGIDYKESAPTEEYMKIANNVALSKHYAYLFLENWPLYVGGTAVAVYLLSRRR